MVTRRSIVDHSVNEIDSIRTLSSSPQQGSPKCSSKDSRKSHSKNETSWNLFFQNPLRSIINRISSLYSPPTRNSDDIKPNPVFRSSHIPVDEGNSWSGKHQLVFSLLLLMAVITRSLHFESPSDVVFDEMHFGSYVNAYLKGQYFFDLQPPFVKLVLAGVGKIIGYDGNFPFSRIGSDYLQEMGTHFIALRMIPSLCSIAVVPLAFAFLTELQVSLIASSFACISLIFDNALISTGKFMSLESVYLFLTLACLYTFWKARKHSYYHFYSGILLGACISSRYTAFYTTCLFILFVNLYDFVMLLKSRQYESVVDLRRHVRQKIINYVLIPVFVYLLIHFVHFSILSKSGSGDSLMSVDFQASLYGSRHAPIANSQESQSRDWKSISALVYVGSNVTFRNLVEEIYLHSHSHQYPQAHNGKVSSQGQQVTGYTDPLDPLNYWTIELPPPNISFDENGHVMDLEVLRHLPSICTGAVPSTEEVEEMLQTQQAQGASADLQVQIKKSLVQGDIIRLKHSQTGKYLLTHDVASSLTLTNMEVSCFDIDELKTRYNNTLFKLEYVQNASVQQKPELVSSLIHFRLVHVRTSVYLRNHQQNLPEDWGFSQREINGSKNDISRNTIWTIESVVWPAKEGTLDPKASIAMNTPSGRHFGRPLGFFAKFIEHQLLTFRNAAILKNLPKPHPYACHPLGWPFLLRGISMWDNIITRRQIYLIGNPVVWLLAVVSLAFLVGSYLRFYLRRKEKISSSLVTASSNIGLNNSPPTSTIIQTYFIQSKLIHQSGYLLLGYLVHFLPFIVIALSTNANFINFYLPSFAISLMLLAVTFDFLLDLLSLKRLSLLLKFRNVIFISLVLSIMGAYWFFAPFTYAWPLTTFAASLRQWLPSWHFLVTLHPDALPQQ